MSQKLQQLANLAISKLETDFTNDLIVPDEVSCAYALTTVLREFDKEIPVIMGTAALLNFFRKSPKFTQVLEPEAGVIVICATGTNTRPKTMPHGHVGIYIDENRIISNDSASGLWKQNYNRETWRKRYYYRGGYPVRLFKYNQ